MKTRTIAVMLRCSSPTTSTDATPRESATEMGRGCSRSQVRRHPLTPPTSTALALP